MKKYFLPRGKNGRYIVLRTFVGKVGTYATKYGITNAQVKDMQDSETYLLYLNKTAINATDYAQSANSLYDELADGTTGVVNAMPALAIITAPTTVPSQGIFDRFLVIVNTIKNHPSYLVSDGEDMGIEGAEFTVDKLALQPVLKLVIDGSYVVVSSPKEGTQGFEVWVDRGNGTFTFIGFATGAKFKDMAPIPAEAQTWKYKAIFHLHNEQVGQWSDVKSITVSA